MQRKIESPSRYIHLGFSVGEYAKASQEAGLKARMNRIIMDRFFQYSRRFIFGRAF